jgi:hypothetical protein
MKRLLVLIVALVALSMAYTASAEAWSEAPTMTQAEFQRATAISVGKKWGDGARAVVERDTEAGLTTCKPRVEAPEATCDFELLLNETNGRAKHKVVDGEVSIWLESCTNDPDRTCWVSESVAHWYTEACAFSKHPYKCGKVWHWKFG